MVLCCAPALDPDAVAVCGRSYLEVVWAFLWQIFLLHQEPDRWSIIGAVLITSCAVVNPVKMWRAAHPNQVFCHTATAKE
jgi:drug/metabolite transporter (DMT)-like permease